MLPSGFVNSEWTKTLDNKKSLTLFQWIMIGLVLIIAVGTWFSLRGRALRGEQAEAFTFLKDIETLEQRLLGAEVGKEATWEKILALPQDKQAEYEAALKKAVSETEKNPVAHALACLRYARYAAHLEKNEEALQAYQRVLNLEPKQINVLFFSMAHEGKGAVLENGGRLDEALKNYEEALSLKDNPVKHLAYFGKARVLVELGKKAEAVAVYETLIKEYTDEAINRRARILKARL